MQLLESRWVCQRAWKKLLLIYHEYPVTIFLNVYNKLKIFIDQVSSRSIRTIYLQNASFHAFKFRYLNGNILLYYACSIPKWIIVFFCILGNLPTENCIRDQLLLFISSTQLKEPSAQKRTIFSFYILYILKIWDVYGNYNCPQMVSFATSYRSVQ